MIDGNGMLSEREAAKLLGLTPSALRKWRQIHRGPHFFRLSARCVRYIRQDIESWIAEGQVQPEATAR